jgi:ATP-dependent Lhr-like helicase
MPDGSSAVQEIVRRAMVTSGPVLPVDLAHHLSLPVESIVPALIALEANGAVFRGRFISRPDSGNTSPEQSDAVQWCDRHVLERIHRQTLSLLRASVEPCNDAELTALRLKWNGIGEVPPRTGIDGVRSTLEQMSSLAFTAELWEHAILPARVADYRPEYLDLLCMSGEFAWVAVPLNDPSQLHREFPASVAFLQRRAASYSRPSEMPADSHSQIVAEVLARFGAQYLDQIAERANLSERDTLTALWRLAAAGRVSNDSFAPLRLLAAEPDAARLISNRPAHREPSRHDAAVRARLQSSLSGRWSLVPQLEVDPAPAPTAEVHDAHATDTVREIALMLLRRHGILAREMMALEQIEVSWQRVLFALRRLEYAGIIRRGWFVRALSGEQYALPEALEKLRSERENKGIPAPLVVNAIDPANPSGVLLPGCGIAREPGNLIVIQHGNVIAGLAGRAFTSSVTDEGGFVAAIRELMKRRPRLVLESINGEPALESVHVPAMAAMGFHSDGRALVHDGLPGPTPMRALASRAAAGQH